MPLQINTDAKADISAEKLYDTCLIDQLCRGNQDQVKKMVKIFIDQIPQSIEDIKSAYIRKDFVVLKNVAHRIKPMISYYAIVKIEKDIQKIEALAKEELATIELELRIMRLDEVANLVVEKMKQDFLY
jgi:HPt (histidine-containing phosphotransfer) domain-containing protein